MTTTTKSWKDEALEAYEAFVAGQRARQEQTQQLRAMRLTHELATAVSEIIGREISPDMVQIVNDLPQLDLDGVVFTQSHASRTNEVLVLLECEECGRTVPSFPINSRAALGSLLAGDLTLPLHECGRTPGDRNYVAPQPTLEARLCELLRELIREEVRQWE